MFLLYFGGGEAVLRLMMLSKYNSLARNLSLGLASAMVGAYGIMSVFWLVTGMRFNAFFCCRVYLWAYAVLTAVMTVISFSIAFRRQEEFDRIIEHGSQKGYDDEYFRMLEEHMGGLDSDRKIMLYASCLIEGGRYAESREIVRRVDFGSLSAGEQNEYFNICLYSALMEGKLELANEIYAKARAYFDRATLKRGNGNIVHTLGELCFANGRYENAQRLFETARREKNAVLRCECDIGICKCRLAQGDIRGAKDLCFAVAEEASTRHQAQRLRELMKEVEKDFGEHRQAL